MKIIGRSILLFPLFTGFLVLVLSHGFSIEGRAQKSSEPEIFTTFEGRFSIALPAQVHSFQPLSSSTPNGRATGNAYSWTMPEAQFIAGYMDVFREAPDNPNVVKSMFDNIRNDLVAKAAAANGKLQSERDLSQAGNLGRELKIEFPEGLFIIRMYLINGRFYQLTAALMGEKRQQESPAIRILDTFKVLTQSDVEAGLRQKIAKA